MNFDDLEKELLDWSTILYPKLDSELKNDIEFLVSNPTKTLGSKYHDAGSCWKLIDGLIEYIRNIKNEKESKDGDA